MRITELKTQDTRPNQKQRTSGKTKQNSAYDMMTLISKEQMSTLTTSLCAHK